MGDRAAWTLHARTPMVNVPPAIIENAPFYKRAWLRRLATIAFSLILLYGSCKAYKRLTRGVAYDRIAKQQEAARKVIGDGLDELFDDELDGETNDVKLATLIKNGGVGDGYTPDHCATGLNAAFKDVLGSDVVAFSGMPFHEADTLELTGTVSPSGSGFQLPHSEKVYPGIALAGEVKFLGHTFPIDVKPPADIKFTHYTYGGFGYGSHGPDDSDVAGGIMQGTCQELGYAILEKLTSWKRPAPPPKADPLVDCERGFHCKDSAEALEDSDPAKAAKLYGMACRNHDDDACVRFGELELSHAREPGERAANLRVTLDLACANDLPGACGMAGAVAALPEADGKPPSEYHRAEALVFFVRACDLDNTDACAGAATMLKGTPFAEAAPLLSGKRTVPTKFGTAFALRWGQWTQFDGGQATLWVTQQPARVPEGALVRQFSGDEIPKGIVPPRGVGTVYAIALRGGTDRCSVCNSSERGSGPFALRAMNCVCVIARPSRQSTR